MLAQRRSRRYGSCGRGLTVQGSLKQFIHEWNKPMRGILLTANQGRPHSGSDVGGDVARHLAKLLFKEKRPMQMKVLGAGPALRVCALQERSVWVLGYPPRAQMFKKTSQSLPCQCLLSEAEMGEATKIRGLSKAKSRRRWKQSQDVTRCKNITELKNTQLCGPCTATNARSTSRIFRSTGEQSLFHWTLAEGSGIRVLSCRRELWKRRIGASSGTSRLGCNRAATVRTTSQPWGVATLDKR